MSNRQLRLTLLLGLVVVAVGAPGEVGADTIGTLVTGTLIFPENSAPAANYFDPTNGGVPATGYENSASAFNSPTVPISGTAIEFGYSDAADTDTADFNGSTLTISDLLNPGAFATPFRMTFSDSAFAGATLATVSDTFPGGLTASLSGTTLTATFGGTSTPGTYTASFTLTPAVVPEPAALFLASQVALLAAGCCWFRARRAKAA